jgi:hypothetical protein
VHHTWTGQSATISAPDFGCYLKAFERHSNLNWLPSVSNLPASLALRAPPALVQITPRQAAVAATAPASKRRDLGPHLCNPGRNARFTCKIVFAKNVRTRWVEEAIYRAEGRDTLLKIDRDGVSIGVCVSPIMVNKFALKVVSGPVLTAH